MKEQVLPNALKTRYRTYTIFPFYAFFKSKISVLKFGEFYGGW
jgi:hypothetical protein